MAFALNSFSESPFAAIVENTIVAVTGQALALNQGNEGVVIDVSPSVTGNSNVF